MLEQQGVIIEISDGECLVAIGASGACAGCEQACSPSPDAAERRLRVGVPHGIAVRVGDRVVVGLSARQTAMTALALYIFPLVFLLFGAAIGSLIQGCCATSLSHDGLALMGGGTAFIACVALIRKSGVVDALAPRPVLLCRLDS